MTKDIRKKLEEGTRLSTGLRHPEFYTKRQVLRAVMPLLDKIRKYYSEVEGKKRWGEKAPVASFLADFFDFIEETLLGEEK